jgi:presqualene diphosphate synthase
MNKAVPAESVLRQHAKSSSFHMAMLLLPRQKRKALLTLYAVCRVLDDAVDDAASPQDALARLSYWQDAFDAALSGSTTTAEPLAQSLALQHQRFGFESADLTALCAAMRHDAAGNGIIASYEDLERYCYGAAGAVGLLAMRIFGCEQPQARPFAIALGHALQLTNILRDIRVDARMGRIYLPADWLTQPHSPQQVAAMPHTVQRACQRLAAKALAHFAEADRFAAALPARAIAPALAMRDVYALYWRKLEAADWQAPQNGKINLNSAEKAALAARASGYLLGHFKAVE